MNWIGSMIETTGTELRGLVVGVELMYPRHPESPARMLDVMWTSESVERGGLRLKNEPIGKVSPFSVKRVLSRPDSNE